MSLILADFCCSFSRWLSYNYTVVQRPTLLLRGHIPLLLCCALNSVELTDDIMLLYLPYNKERVRSGLFYALFWYIVKKTSSWYWCAGVPSGIRYTVPAASGDQTTKPPFQVPGQHPSSLFYLLFLVPSVRRRRP